MSTNERIKELRISKKLSQKDFAKSINLSQNHISSIEKGLRDMTTRSLEDVCRVYNVNKDWLVNGEGDMFVNVLDEFGIKDKEVEEFARMFLELDQETKTYISGLMKKTLKK